MPKKQKRIIKVAKFRIIKPAGEMTWDELGKIFRDVRYRVYRLANLAVSEMYVHYQLSRKSKSNPKKKPPTVDQLNHRLRDMLKNEGVKEEELSGYSARGVVSSYITPALAKYKIGGIRWKEVLSGRISLPNYRNDMAIPIRCDQPSNRRLEKTSTGDVELDLLVRRRPYPRVLVGTKNIGEGQEAVLRRLLDNDEQSLDGYRQRCFEVKQDRQNKKWWLYVTYDFPEPDTRVHSQDIVVGVDLGVSVPLYAAINNGWPRLGRRQFQALGARIRKLQNQVDARRRSIQRGGRVNLNHNSARSGHGRKRKLMPTEKLQGRIDKAYTTLNHQLSSAVIDFAKNHGAGTIQIEELETLKDQLVGTFIGRRWRYYQLQHFLEYKAEEAGMLLRKVNPTFTSRRCSNCGYIHIAFDRAYRDSHRTDGRVAKFICPACNYEADPDYNAARNLATLDIENKIRLQCKKQDIEYKAL